MLSSKGYHQNDWYVLGAAGMNWPIPRHAKREELQIAKTEKIAHIQIQTCDKDTLCIP